MSDHLHYFAGAAGVTAVALPFSLDDFTRDWSRLRPAMIREMPPQFARDEWAYLVTFLGEENLAAAFARAFGTRMTEAPGKLSFLARPRGPVAVWLPNNVSLLGPLILVMLSATGNSLRLKGGSHSEDLAGVFLDFARRSLPPGPARACLLERVVHDVFERDDPRHRAMAAEAKVRIVFGSDAAAEAIHALPHPLSSAGFSFVDRRSEAWIESAALDDGVLRDLIKVFTIYGQAGCTSPRRVVLLGGDRAETIALRDRLLELWPDTVRRPPQIHQASENIMARQWAAANGWDARLAPQNSAVLAAGEIDCPEFGGSMSLMIAGGTVERAVASLPANIQTLGCAFARPEDPRWTSLVAGTGILRLASIPRMHHFGPVWDGQDFWAACFEPVAIQT
jgi:hypothetical protein